MPHKKKVKNIKPIVNHDKPQIDLKKSLDSDKKIQPEKVFVEYKKQDKKKKK